jgi:sterol desaturase/sphingolipid hydroxylase (fatty acid hydroxylase superfamily)
MLQFFIDHFAIIQGWFFEHVVQPALHFAGMDDIIEDAFDGTEWFLAGAVELLVLFFILRPLEALIPAKRVTAASRRIDFLYTCLHRLGLFNLLMFFLFGPLFDQIGAWMSLHNIEHYNLEQLWPGVTDIPLVSFVVYLVVLDFFGYWYHRWSHQFNWWWGLHSLHHSQREMNLWSDDRNHLLDDMLQTVFMAVIALVIGVEPAQYVWLVIASRMLQSLQHANVRLHFGAIGERLLVSPRFHRTHHAIGVGHEASEGVVVKKGIMGCNFGVLFPFWDMLFRTADFRDSYEDVGVRDQLPPPQGQGRNYGRGFWAQQWFGLKRMVEFIRKAPV